MGCKDPLLPTDDQGDYRIDSRADVKICVSVGKEKSYQTMRTTYSGESAALEAVAVLGRRVLSWRRFDTPDVLLNDEFDLPNLWLFEKLLFCGISGRRENIVAAAKLCKLAA